MNDLRIPSLLAAYRAGTLTPGALADVLIAALPVHAAYNIWTTPPDTDALRSRAQALEARGMEGLPLYGVPFVVKDNIDISGHPTSAACKAFQHIPDASATVVQRLLDAGALLVGKTNLDQFATGLNGTRSDFGVCRNAFDPEWIAGGSSSGSAVAVALGFASFALGTDTAGSGRVPAAFNNLIGFKPTRGRVSTRGVLPACRSLDCVSVFALDARDATTVFDLIEGGDPHDAALRTPRPGPLAGFGLAGVRVAIPRPGQLETDCDADTLAAFARSTHALREAGTELVEIDITPFLDAALLLYEGPWVAERYAAIKAFFDHHEATVHPVVRGIIARGKAPLAHESFEAGYRLAELRRAAERAMADCDALLLPTTPAHYTVDAVLADPVGRNNALGRYTNFVNLFDLCAVAIPAGRRTNGLPVGVTLLASAFADHYLLGLAAQLQPLLNQTAGREQCPVSAFEPARVAPSGSHPLAVVGAHMSGLALNTELTGRGARLLRPTRTAPNYRLYAMAGRIARPALIAVNEGGASINAEVWAIPTAQLGGFLAGIPAPLGLGKVALEDGSEVIGFIGEAAKISAATDITAYGGWRAWLARPTPSPV